MSNFKYTDQIIVIIATSNKRTNLLYERSLRSVYEQVGINPHQIYIVDDNVIPEHFEFSNEYGEIKTVINKLRDEILQPKYDLIVKNQPNKFKFENYFHTTLIKNQRTKGFSGTGAWNTAAFKALQYSDRNYFLAFLDDDDEWKPDYLNTLFKSVSQPKKIRINGKLKKIQTIASIAGLLRIEKENKVKLQASKDVFNKESFFVSNPGLQGSNLFIELKTFWTIGGFDESLKSATDRDLGIRLAEYVRIRPSKKVIFIDNILVNHYAISEERVTTNSKNKKQGLDLFYRKYYHQFPKEVQDKSLQRAQELFNYRISDQATAKTDNHFLQNKIKKKIEPFNLIIGTISDNADALIELFKSFYNLYQKHGKWLKDYRFLVLENTNNEYEIRPIIDYFVTRKNLNIELINNINKGLSISENRNYLQQKVYKKGFEEFGNNQISWIIDDDCLFKTETNFKTTIPNYFAFISQYKNKNIDALFGLVSDAPPLPFLSTLRTQLIDFYYNLTYFSNCNPEESFKLNKWQKINIQQNEFYYDLSNINFQHLEYPYYRNSKELTNFDAFNEFLNDTSLLSNGVNVFRKLTFDPVRFGNIIRTSIYRGGNTIIFNPELLKTPNYTPEKEYNRRSDFNWSIINKDIFKRELYEIIMPLKHDRRLQKTSLVTNKNKLQADIKGLIFYRLLEFIVHNDNWGSKTNHKQELRFYEQLKKQTFTKIKINNYRIQNLIHLILEILKDVKLWWFKNEYRAETNFNIQQNIFTLEVLRIELGKRKFQILIQELEDKMKIDNDFINRVILEVKRIIQKTRF